jgi:hypothetical protein
LEQVILGIEVAVDGRLCDLRGPGEFVHLDFDIGALREHLRGSEHNALPAVIAAAGGERQGHDNIELPSFIGRTL